VNARHLIAAGVISLAAMSAVACGSGGSAGSGGSSASSATPGFTTSCKVTGLIATNSGTALNFDMSVTAAKAADVTDVDVEFSKDGVALSTQDQTYDRISDGGDGVLMSVVSAMFPVFLTAGKSWSYTASADDYLPMVGVNGFSATPDSCKVIVVATTANPGNF
jgi:hypothetical protein